MQPDRPPGRRSRNFLPRVFRRLKWRLESLRKLPYPDDEWDPVEYRPSVLSVVKVADLPYPHNLFRCKFAERFSKIAARYPEDDETGGAGREFMDGLNETDLSGCPYHMADWAKVAALSIAVLDRMQRGQRQTRAVENIRRRFGLTEHEEWALNSLLGADSIYWGFDEAQLGNGQHRVCGLKKAGADKCVVRR